MSINLTDWLGDNPWALWLTVALLLGIAEVLSLDLVLIMLAAGALAGAGVSLIAPGMWWLQILVAAGASVGMLAILRPTLLVKVRAMPGYRSSLDKMVGSVGVATAEITHHNGEVKIDGLTWSARTMDDETTVEPGDTVEVYEVDGVTAIVYPMKALDQF